MRLIQNKNTLRSSVVSVTLGFLFVVSCFTLTNANTTTNSNTTPLVVIGQQDVQQKQAEQQLQLLQQADAVRALQAIDNDGFTEISIMDNTAAMMDDISFIDIIPVCVGNGNGGGDTTVPNTMFTIYPSDTVTVSSYPANLVSVTIDNSGGANSGSGGTTMKFAWGDGAFDGGSSPGGGGVKIGIPVSTSSNSLKRVDVDGGMMVQILDGFSQMETLNVMGASKMWGTFYQLNSYGNEISLSVDGNSEAIVDSTGPLGEVRVGGASVVKTKAPSIDDIDVNGSSKLVTEGNIAGGSVDGGSTVKATGAVIGGFLEVEGGSKIRLGLNGCDNGSVSESDATSSCKDFDDVTVDAYAYTQEYTMSGDGTCTFSGASGLLGVGGGVVGVAEATASSDSSSGSNSSITIGTCSVIIATIFAATSIFLLISSVL